MARYVTKVRTPRSAAEAFAYMSDLRNFAEWDPGVRSVVQVDGDGAGPAATYDVTVRNGRRDMMLRYRTVEFEPSTNLLVVAETRSLISTDRVSVHVEQGTTTVTYDADLRLKGALRFADPILRLMFSRIGDRAAAGLRRVLDGEKVA
jgi:carbon monoxide dehydrogenase subunit G